MRHTDIQNWASSMMRTSFTDMKNEEEDDDEDSDLVEDDANNEDDIIEKAEKEEKKEQAKEENVKELKKKNIKQLTCGEGHRGLLELVMDNSDFDVKALVLGHLTKEKMTLYSGSTVEKEFDLKEIVLPVLTIDDKCISIREKDDFGTILCSKSLKSRDKWLNYLHEAILCKITGVKGKLPEEPGKAVEEAMAKVEQLPVEEPASGVNIHIDDAPSGEKPAILINGMTIGEVQHLQRQRAVADVMPQPPKPSISDFPNPNADNDPQQPNHQNALGEPKTQEEIDALNEALAEQKQIPLEDESVPKKGYASATMSS